LGGTKILKISYTGEKELLSSDPEIAGEHNQGEIGISFPQLYRKKTKNESCSTPFRGKPRKTRGPIFTNYFIHSQNRIPIKKGAKEET